MKTFNALALAALLATPTLAETLRNESVVELSKMGFGDEAIIAKIKASEATFDTSTQAMITLKSQGVSMPVIAAMLQASGPKAPLMSMDSADPMVPHPTGVYVLNGVRMARIDPTATNQAKTGGIWGYALTGGIASMSVKAAIQNETARVKASTEPTFYFFFDESNPETAQRVTAFASGDASTVTSPSEFTLIHLAKKDGRREARVGSVNIGGAKTGVMDHDRIAFSYEMVRPGVFKVTPSSGLKVGEYGFIYAIGGATRGAITARIFDFSVG